MVLAIVVAMFASLACLALLVVGVVIAIRGGRGELVDQSPRCRQCDYNLSGHERRPSRCQECGAYLDAPGAVRLGLRRAQPRVIAGGVAICIGAAAIGSLAVWPRTATAPALIVAAPPAAAAPARPLTLVVGPPVDLLAPIGTPDPITGHAFPTFDDTPTPLVQARAESTFDGIEALTLAGTVPTAPTNPSRFVALPEFDPLGVLPHSPSVGSSASPGRAKPFNTGIAPIPMSPGFGTPVAGSQRVRTRMTPSRMPGRISPRRFR